MSLEEKVFLALCQCVRKEQEYRKGGSRSTSMYIMVKPERVYMHCVNIMGVDVTAKQVYAILYKLQDRGYVKMKTHLMKRGQNVWKGKLVGLDHKGVQLVKRLKSQVTKG